MAVEIVKWDLRVSMSLFSVQQCCHYIGITYVCALHLCGVCFSIDKTVTRLIQRFIQIVLVSLINNGRNRSFSS